MDQELRASLNSCSCIITQAPQSMIQGPLNSMTIAKENWQHGCVQGLSNLQRIKLSSLNTGLGSATCRQVKVENPNKSLSAGYNLMQTLDSKDQKNRHCGTLLSTTVLTQTYLQTYHVSASTSEKLIVNHNNTSSHQAPIE